MDIPWIGLMWKCDWPKRFLKLNRSKVGSSTERKTTILNVDESYSRRGRWSYKIAAGGKLGIYVSFWIHSNWEGKVLDREWKHRSDENVHSSYILADCSSRLQPILYFILPYVTVYVYVLW